MFSGDLGRAENSGGSREAGAFHCHSQHLGGQYQLEHQLEVVSVGDRYQWKVFGRWVIGVNFQLQGVVLNGGYKLEVSISSVWSESNGGQSVSVGCQAESIDGQCLYKMHVIWSITERSESGDQYKW
jgi:hypothetical protein